MMMNNTNNKSTFARVLATENILVEHRASAETASFNTETRQLVLPKWNNMPGFLYDMLIGHEVGHALFTTNAMGEAVDRIAEDDGYSRGIVHGYTNVVEDARIERLMKNKFPGLAKDFFRGYEDLDQRDLFGLEGVDRKDLPLIDRINLHFKLGTIGAKFNFTDEEQVFVDRCATTQTEDDVMDVVRDLLAYSQQKEDATETRHVNVGDETGRGNGDIEIDGPQEEVEEGNGDEDDTDTTEEGDSNPKGEGADGPCPSRPMTQEALDQNLQDMQDKGSHVSDIKYVDMPNCDLDSFIQDYTDCYDDIYKSLNEEVDDDTRFRILNEAKQWITNSNKVVNRMAAEFDRKKSAAAFRKVQISKTGILDMQKMVDYKWSEDIFRKNMVLPRGKNHGMCVLVDWSGSMGGIMQDAIKQMVQMALFCRKVNIPFEVFSFSSNLDGHGYGYSRPVEDVPVNGSGFTSARDANDVTIDSHPNVVLRNYLSSRMSKKEFDRAVMGMLYIAQAMCEYNIPMPPRHMLGGTPLDEALCVLRHWIPGFRDANNIEIMNCITITDGAGGRGPWRYDGWGSCILRDGTTTYAEGLCTDQDTHLRETDQIVKCIRDKTGTKMINFFLDERKKLRTDHWGYSEADDHKVQSYNKEGWYMEDKNLQGYDQRFIMRGTNTVSDLDLDDLDESATITKVKNTFVKSLSQQGTSRTMLSKLIDQIA
jgi:hypothetical protein